MTRLLQSRSHRILAAIISGILFYFVFGLNPLWFAAWLAPIPLLLAAFNTKGREARLLAWLAAAMGLTSQISYYWRVTGPMATIVLVILQILLWGFFIGRTRAAVLASSHWLTLFFFPTLAGGVDTLVIYLSPHGTAGSTAFAQLDFLPVVQIASVLGLPAIVFLVNLFASTVAVALYRGRSLSRPLLGYGLAAAILVASLGWGAYRLHSAAQEPTVKVGLAAIDEFVGPGMSLDRIGDGYDKAVKGMAAWGAHIIVLPEKIFWLDPDDAADQRQHFSQLARQAGVYLVVGLRFNQADRNRNVSLLFSPSGELLGEYDKQHMVPHLESDLTPGHQNMVRSIDGKPYGLVICRDMFFTRLTRGYSRLGVAALLIPAWDFDVDAWWASRVAAMGGVEGGYSVVRSSRESFMAVSDRYGRIVAQQRSSKLPGSILLASLPLGPATPTLYARFGDIFGCICVAAAALALAMPRNRAVKIEP